MDQSEPQLPRRTFLSGAAASLGLLALSGCDTGSDPAAQHGPDPLTPVLAATVYLCARYDAAIAAIPDLEAKLKPLRDLHKAHITALTRELGTVDSGTLPSAQPPAVSPPAPAGSQTASGAASGGLPTVASPIPLPTERAAIVADLRTLERTGQRQAAAACLSGPTYRAALLGSIAAARASAAEVLS